MIDFCFIFPKIELSLLNIVPTSLFAANIISEIAAVGLKAVKDENKLIGYFFKGRLRERVEFH